MDSGAVNLPPGFEMEQPASPSNGGGSPNLPPGFEMENSGPGKESYWGDVGKNALEGVKEIPGGAMKLADTATRAAAMTSPVEMGRSIFQAARGTPISQTDIPQDVQSTAQGVKGAAAGMWQGAKDVGNAAIMPAQMVTGTPAEDTNFAQSFRQRPLSTTANVLSTVAPAVSMFKRGASAIAGRGAGAGTEMVPSSEASSTPSIFKDTAESTPNYLEVKGAQGLNSLAGIRGNTVANMAKSGENPGAVGTDLARTLSQEGAIGKTATETFSKASKVANTYGKKVAQALQAIRDANKGLGVYPELEDSLKVEANPLLKPIIDQANALKDSGYPMEKAAARGWRAMYNSLSNKAKAGGDFLTLDDIHDELQKVGSMYDTAGPNNTGIVDQLYKHLAGLRDDMVNDIASRSGDPKLASDLIQSNAGYSRYMRVLPDIKKAAASESVGQMNLGGLFKDLKNTILSGPTASKATMKAGTFLRGGEAAAESTPVSALKHLTPEMARDYVRQAQGDKTMARQLARKDGWTF